MRDLSRFLMQDKKVLTTSSTATSSDMGLEAGCDMTEKSGGKQGYQIKCQMGVRVV